jgi:hypothetical protein
MAVYLFLSIADVEANYAGTWLSRSHQTSCLFSRNSVPAHEYYQVGESIPC